MPRRTPLRIDRAEPEVCTLSRRLEVLHHTPFFAGLSHSEVNEISRLFHQRAIELGQTLYVAGEPAAHLYVVAAGKVKLMRTTTAGKNVVITVAGPGDFFGSLSTLGESRYENSAVAHTAGCVLFIGARDFEDIVGRHPAVARGALAVVAERLREMHEIVESLSAHPAEQRIATALLKLAERLGEKRGSSVLIQMPLSREDLADMTGTTRETASRILSRLRRSGLIRTGRAWVAILDPDGLASEAAPGA